ncbi:MAG: insulinase family protein [Acidimicrobiia bacterium]|nr:insulinase family protein [Acidimicrobiia bacterium]
MDERVSTLSNGLTIATDRVPGARSVAIGVWVAVGSRDEPPELSGVSHFLEHLLFKGTPTRSAVDISRAVDRVGGDINAFTSKEYTAYYCRMPRRHAGVGFELLGDVLTASTIAADDVESERQVILEELAMDDDSPDDVALRQLGRQLFGDHGLGRDTAGGRATVRSITPDDVRQFFGEHYRTGATVVAAAGDIDHEHVVDRIAEAFGPMAAGDGRIARAAPGAPEDDMTIDDDSEQIHLAIGGRSVPREDPDREALDVVNHVFGGGLSSRLFDEIRERRGLAYSVYSATSAYADAGAWSVYAGTMPEHAPTVRSLIGAELDRLVADGITDEELEVAAGYLVGAYEMGLEDTGARMSRLGGMLATMGRVRPVDEQIRRWEQVDHSAVRRVIDRVYGAAAPVTVAVGPVGS